MEQHRIRTTSIEELHVDGEDLSIARAGEHFFNYKFSH